MRPQSTPSGRAASTTRLAAHALEEQHGSILVGVDGRAHDDDALTLAQALAPAFAGEILLLVHVLPEGPLGLGMAEFRAAERRDGEVILARAAAAITGPVDTELVNPWPIPLALERLAFMRHASLIVLGSAHRTDSARIVPGGLALRLLKDAPCPVAVAPVRYAQSTGPIVNVGVAYDATSGSDQALAAAALVATRLKAPLHVYHAVACGRPDESPSDPAITVGNTVLGRARAQLGRSLETRTRLLAGPAATVLTQAIGEDGISLLFAGCRGHGPVRAGLFGGVCRELLATAQCPVVLIGEARARR